MGTPLPSPRPSINWVHLERARYREQGAPSCNASAFFRTNLQTKKPRIIEIKCYKMLHYNESIVVYRVGHLLADLGWVDLDLECSTIMLGKYVASVAADKVVTDTKILDLRARYRYKLAGSFGSVRYKDTMPLRGNGKFCISEPDTDPNWLGSFGSPRYT